MKAYIFDLDGTLFDSMDVWKDIDVKFLKKRGIDVPTDYMDIILSMSLVEIASYTVKRFNLPDSIEDVTKEWNAMAKYAYENKILMKPFSKEYLLSLYKSKAKLAVATGLPNELFIPALRNHGIYEMFQVHCSTNEVKHGKVNPEIFLFTAKKLGVSTHECVVFEDTLEAIKSAKSIGMTVYGVYDKASNSQWEQIKQISDGNFSNFKFAPLPK